LHTKMCCLARGSFIVAVKEPFDFWSIGANIGIEVLDYI
jgi:hypothetical protein